MIQERECPKTCQ